MFKSSYSSCTYNVKCFDLEMFNCGRTIGSNMTFCYLFNKTKTINIFPERNEWYYLWPGNVYFKAGVSCLCIRFVRTFPERRQRNKKEWKGSLLAARPENHNNHRGERHSTAHRCLCPRKSERVVWRYLSEGEYVVFVWDDPSRQLPWRADMTVLL